MDWISNEGLTGLSEISSLKTVWTTLKNLRHFHIELVVKEKIFNAILDALELQLELKLPNIGFDHI